MLEKKPIKVEDIETHVARDSTAAFLFTVLIGLWAYWLLPQYVYLPADPVSGLLTGIQLATVPFVVLLVAVLLVSYERRRSATEWLDVECRSPGQCLAFKLTYLQNTVEQTLLFVGALVIGSTLLYGDMFAFLYAATFLFLVGRIAFYFGFRKHPIRRVFGMALTILPTIILYAFSLAVFVKDIAQSVI